jgi:hypothetical protein
MTTKIVKSVKELEECVGRPGTRWVNAPDRLAFDRFVQAARYGQVLARLDLPDGGIKAIVEDPNRPTNFHELYQWTVDEVFSGPRRVKRKLTQPELTLEIATRLLHALEGVPELDEVCDRLNELGVSGTKKLRFK